MFLTYVQRQPFCLCFPEMDDTFKPLYSDDELAVRNMYLGFFSMPIYLFCICVLGLAYFHIDDSCDSLDRNHLPLKMQDSSLVMKVTRILLTKKTLCKKKNKKKTLSDRGEHK